MATLVGPEVIVVEVTVSLFSPVIRFPTAWLLAALLKARVRHQVFCLLASGHTRHVVQ
jgi:hypothetical protein